MRRMIVAASSALALALTGCTVTQTSQGNSPPTTPQPAPSGVTGLDNYYGQSLQWSSCGGGNQCALLTVPMDYADPGAQDIQLSLLKVPARSKSARIGSLIVNPGGPGGSGVDYAAAADYIVGAPVRKAYDIVGFDPRGVGRSEPIDCVSDPELDTFLGFDPTPDTPAEEQAFADNSAHFASACGANAGPLLPHVSTEDVARDMDILRAALGDEKLTYLGKSYGTFIGATYAKLFPSLVGRVVLDGVVPPDLTNEQINLGQAEGFERATRAWAADCVEQGDCPLGSSVDQVMTGMQQLLLDLDQQPAKVTGDARVTQLTEGWAALGIAAAMYDQGSWFSLTSALTDLTTNGDGTKLMSLADFYADRTSGGKYTGNIMEVIYAVNCLDRPDSKDLATYEQASVDATKVAPTWGKFLAWSSLPCGYWPVQTGNVPEKITAEGSDTIVVVGTTRDPATPYEWSVQLNDELANSVLVTYDGDGHTAYTRSNSCVDNAIDDFYVKGTVPKDGLTC